MSYYLLKMNSGHCEDCLSFLLHKPSSSFFMLHISGSIHTSSLPLPEPRCFSLSNWVCTVLHILYNTIQWTDKWCHFLCYVLTAAPGPSTLPLKLILPPVLAYTIASLHSTLLSPHAPETSVTPKSLLSISMLVLLLPTLSVLPLIPFRCEDCPI